MSDFVNFWNIEHYGASFGDDSDKELTQTYQGYSKNTTMYWSLITHTHLKWLQ